LVDPSRARRAAVRFRAAASDAFFARAERSSGVMVLSTARTHFSHHLRIKSRVTCLPINQLLRFDEPPPENRRAARMIVTDFGRRVIAGKPIPSPLTASTAGLVVCTWKAVTLRAGGWP
jgi:hypothetical protein